MDFPLFHVLSKFTDDTVLTVAVAKAILDKEDLAATFKDFTLRYPGGGYGGKYRQWAASDNSMPYNSYGNGSAMRVSPVGWAGKTADEVLSLAEWSAAVTHNHPEGIKGAQSVALAILMARTGKTKEEIRKEISTRFEYDLDRTLAHIRPTYRFDETCQGSVPEAIIAFLESDNFEDAIRKAVSLGGDADTQACIAGSIAEAFYGGVPDALADKALSRLTPHLREIVDRFCKKHVISSRPPG
jgi:ADP-ribosylglycohydrolase